MKPLIPYALAAAVGLVLVTLFFGQVSVEVFAVACAIAGGLSVLVNSLSQKIESRLGDFSKVEGLDDVIERRLADRVGGRRRRLVYKQIATFSCAVVATVLGAALLRVEISSAFAWLIVAAVPAAMVATIGTTLLWVESADLAEKVASLERFAKSKKNNLKSADAIAKAR